MVNNCKDCEGPQEGGSASSIILTSSLLIVSLLFTRFYWKVKLIVKLSVLYNILNFLIKFQLDYFFLDKIGVIYDTFPTFLTMIQLLKHYRIWM